MKLYFQRFAFFFLKLSLKTQKKILVLWILLSAATALSATEFKEKGLKFHTPEQLQHIEEHADWITHVKVNKIGQSRFHEHLKKEGLCPDGSIIAHPHHEEITSTKGLISAKLAHLNASHQTNALPSSVDNSLLPSFPPIGNQGPLGSCVAWGSTYYQATHEIGLLNGINNKTSRQGVLSPKWTYNLLNNGLDEGLWPKDAYQLLSSNGAVSITNFPYDANYLAWDTNTQDWISAISNRLSPVQVITGIGGSHPQNLNTIKQLLSNGHVLTFATYVDSWVYATVKKDPSNPNSPHVGELAVAWMNGANGGHFLTIVGYDDNVWIDINNNGKVDSGEKGAFLIANSWGTNWGNKGFIWIAYDSFRSVSAVPNAPSAHRVPLADAMNSMVFSITPKAPNYKPSLIGIFSITQAARNQISVISGTSSTSVTTPTTSITDFALHNNGGNYEFNGSPVGSPQTVNFAFDMTDLLAGNADGTLQRYYLNLQDTIRGNPTNLNSFTLTDNVHQQSASCNQVPLTCDASTVSAFIDYNFSAKHSNSNNIDVIPPEVNITSPLDNALVTGTINITVNATDNVAVARVDLYVDSQLYLSDPTAPYFFTLDTTQLSEGSHQLTAIAYDISNNQAQNMVTIKVQN